MSLITDYEEEDDVWGGFKTVTYTIGSVHYEEIINPDGTILNFTCFQEGSCILIFYPSANRYKCNVSGIDI